MDTGIGEVFGNRRFNLDGPPPSDTGRPAPPKSPTPSTPESLYASSSGSVTAEDESSSSGDPGIESMASVLALLAHTESDLDELCSRLPKLLPVCTDFVTILRQMVPQEMANMQSQSPMSGATGNPQAIMNQLQSLFGGQGGAGGPGGGMGGGPQGPQRPAPIAGPQPIGAPPGGTGGVMG